MTLLSALQRTLGGRGLGVEVVGGLLVWAVWLIAVGPARTASVLTFAPLVIVPLGLALAARRSTGPVARPLNALIRLCPIAGATVMASYTVEQGGRAGLVALPWLAFTIAVGAVGVARLLSRRTLRHPGIGVDVGMIFLAVGGGWLVISRAGVAPLGFSAAIVELTAMHFHFAGFALPILAAVTADRLDAGVVAPVAVVTGVPLTALGITVGGAMEWLAATVMAAAGLLVAVATARLAGRLVGTARLLLGIAAAALTGGMALAVGWAWSMRFGWTYLDLDAMVATHGMLNGFGFCLLGLIAMNLLPEMGSDQPDVCLHLGRPTSRRMVELVSAAEDDEPTNPVGLLRRPVPDGFQSGVWSRVVDHGDFARVCKGLRDWAGQRNAGITLHPERPNITVGETLALAIPVGPISVSATARVVAVVDEPDHFGFTYSTLPHHPEDGEESFEIVRSGDGSVQMVVSAVWREGAVCARLSPIARYLQNRAIENYLVGTVDHCPVGDDQTNVGRH